MWIKTTFPVAPGAGSHTFHNLARSATGSPFFARRGKVSQAVVTHYTSLTTNLTLPVQVCARKTYVSKAIYNAVACACLLSCCLDSRNTNRAAPALSEKQASLALRSCLQDHVPDKNFDLVSQLPASLHFGVYCRCAHMQKMLTYDDPAVQSCR